MKINQLVSIFFSVLFCSTLAHEYLHAKELTKHYYSQPRGLHYGERSSENSLQQCTYICKRNDTIPTHHRLQIIVNKTTELIGIFNATAKAALIVDVNAKLVAILDGNTGSVIVVNIESQTGVYIKGGESDLTWVNSEQCFQTYFTSLTTLKIFIDANVGIKFNVKTVSNEILTVLAHLLVHFSKDISIQINKDLNVAIKIFINFGSSLITLFGGSLKGFLNFFGAVFVHITGDLFWLIEVFQGIAIICGSISGGITALIKAGVEFDFNVLLNSTNGIELLVNFLLSIVTRVNLNILASFLNSLEQFLEVIVKLGGGVSYGVTGAFKVIVSIIGFIRGKIHLDVLIQTLIEFVTSRNINQSINILIYIEGLVKVIEVQNSTDSSSSRNLEGFIAIVTGLQNNNLTFNGINLSLILSLIVGTASSALELVIRVLLSLRTIVSVSVCIPTLILYLIKQLNTQSGVVIIKILIPDLKIDVNSENGNLLQSILKGLSLANILQLLTGGISNLLKNLPVIGQIYTSVSSSLSAASNSSISLDSVLKSSGSIEINKQIESVIKGGFHVSVG